MRTNKIPRLVFQKQVQLGEDCWHSVVISLLRGLAAAEVAAAHLRATMYPGLRTVADPSIWYQGLAFATGFGHLAVVIFFIISGWLVGGSLLNKIGQPNAIANFAIDRVTRLWTVLIPTFLLTLLIGLGTGAISLQSTDYSAINEYSVVTLAGNLIGLQEIAVPTFGRNFALWSLANETWYYVAFPLLVVLFTARRNVPRLACGAALVVLVAWLPYAIVLYFSIWLLGVAFSRIRIECGIGQRCAWLVLLIAASVYFRLTGSQDALSPASFPQYLLCSLLFLVFLSSLQFKASRGALLRPVAMIGKFFADFSFSLYALHVPLIGLLHHLATARFGLRQLSPDVPLHYAIYFVMLAILLAASYLAYWLFESQTYRIRRLVKELIVRRKRPEPAGTMPVDS